MKAHTDSYFILQDILSQVIAEAAGNSHSAIVLTDDFIAPQWLSGSSQPLANLFRLLLPNLVTSADSVHLSARPLLQRGSDVLLEFSVAHQKEPGAPSPSSCIAHAPGFIMEAERAIRDLGGRSERIQLSDAGGGLKFILKWGWLPQDLQPASKRAHHFTGRRALIAEDNEVNAKGLHDLLRSFGIEADTAVDGKEAIDLITRKGGHDLLLMDLDMPHMNGVEAARFLRKKLKKEMPIIGLSAAPFKEGELPYEISGLNHCISKSSASHALPSLLPYFLGKAEELIAKDHTQQSLTKWSEHRGSEAHKHATVIHQHRPAF
ncbi:MAG TPA: response regulator [Flavisolibacter sp.]